MLIKHSELITVPSIHQVVKTDGWMMDLISYTSLKQLSVMDRAFVYTDVLIAVPSIHQVVKTDWWKMENISNTSLKHVSVMDRATYL